MRILSWNVNGLRAAEKKGFSSWLQEASPDILCLQETKAQPDQLGPELLHPRYGGPGGGSYHSYWASARRKGYSGTAILSKEEPRAISFLGDPAFDDEGRLIQAEFRDFTLISAYFPNSQDGGARLPYKLDFCAAILAHCDALVASGRNLLLCGDYNIAHTELDLARPRENEGSPGYLPEERAWMDRFTQGGYIDTFRSFHPGEGGHYSWWSWRAKGARERNVGWRLDYHCVNGALMDRVSGVGILSGVEGSDHCPVEISIKD